MESNRRNFLKLTGLAGVGIAHQSFASSVFSGDPHLKSLVQRDLRNSSAGHFNMSGFAAEKLNKVRIGFIGLGNRGPDAVSRMSHIDGTEIKALCDLRPEKAEAVKKALAATKHQPELYTRGEEDWKKLCERSDLDLVYIATPWALHTPMAVYAMNHGKHVCVEVPAAKTIDECWQLVTTSEQTKKHCMILENCCYDFFELLTLNLARQGFFGDIVHGEGGYIHDLLEGNFSKTKYFNMWRLKENFRNGNLYPTHGLGPVAQIMNINRGDKMDSLTSASGKDFSMAAMASELAAKDDFYKSYAGKTYRGNMNTTTIHTANGRTIMLQHDVSSPNIYSRIHKISGTRGSALKYPLPGRIATGHEDWLSPADCQKLEDQYTPPIIKKLGEMAKQVGGHGGMDFMMDWRTIDCLRNGLPLDIDVYDAAAWSAVAPLTEWSVANKSGLIAFPDFTSGSWKTNRPVDVQMQQGGNTGVNL